MISPPADGNLSPISPASPATQPTTPIPLSELLDKLGLGRYLGPLVENGFTTWETILDITEDDLTALNFKLGHRRILQREIATARGLPSSASLEDGTSSVPSVSSPAVESNSATPRGREKRRYRRHPRPDHNAPKKPKTAYVNFADHLRTNPTISSLSFVDIAKEVGRRWQDLPLEEKRMWENQAARANHEYEVQMEEYKKTDLYRNYQLYLEAFKAQQAQAKTGNRSSNSGFPFPRRELSRGSPSSSDSPISHLSPAGTEAESCHNALTLAFSQLVTLRGGILTQDMPPFNGSNLPPEGPVRQAMYAAVKASSLFYMWTYAQVDTILNRVYRPESTVDPMTLAECFTVAAIGAHYDNNCFSDHVRRVLYASGTLQFNEKTARMDYLRTTRILFSMAVYALLEKQMNAKHLVAAALQIARSKMPMPHQSPPNNANACEIWRNIYRSLIFLDSMLCVMGQPAEATSEDLAFAFSPSSEPATLEDIIHIQSAKIALIAASAKTGVASTDLSSADATKGLRTRLDNWRATLPDALRISALFHQRLDVDQRKAVVTLNTLYLGALVLVYRDKLFDVAGAKLQTVGDAWISETTPDETDECMIVSQQLAQVLHVFFDDPSTKQAWMRIYSTFYIGIILLFCALSKLMDGLSDAADENLKYAKGCLDLLQSCSHATTARSYVDILRPMHDNLRDIHQRTVGRVKTSIFSLLQPTDATQRSPPVPLSKVEIQPIFNQLAELIKSPVLLE